MIGIPRRSARDTARWIARLLRAWQRSGDVMGTFERVDSTLLGGSAFRASDSIGLDEVSPNVLGGAVPTRSRDIDRQRRSRH